MRSGSVTCVDKFLSSHSDPVVWTFTQIRATPFALPPRQGQGLLTQDKLLRGGPSRPVCNHWIERVAVGVLKFLRLPRPLESFWRNKWEWKCWVLTSTLRNKDGLYGFCRIFLEVGIFWLQRSMNLRYGTRVSCHRGGCWKWLQDKDGQKYGNKSFQNSPEQ